MPFPIRLTQKEKSLASEDFKRALFDEIEDEYDAIIADDAYAEYLQDPETVSHEEAGKILGLK